MILKQRTVLGPDNTTSKVAAVSFDIPANTVLDGDRLEIIAHTLTTNNSGQSANLAVTIEIDGQVQTIAATIQFANNTNRHKAQQLILFNDGGTLRFQIVSQASQLAETYDPFSSGSTNGLAKSMPVDFTQNQTLTISGQWSVANADISFKCISASLETR